MTEATWWKGNVTSRQSLSIADPSGDVCSASFTSDRYFRTGDIAQRSGQNGDYRLLGRSSVDIIKSGGEKISALELERVISSLEEVADVSVLGLPDEDWGQVVGCVLVITSPLNKPTGSSHCALTDIKGLRDALRSELSPWKLPKMLKIYEHEIPRNVGAIVLVGVTVLSLLGCL